MPCQPVHYTPTPRRPVHTHAMHSQACCQLLTRNRTTVGHSFPVAHLFAQGNLHTPPSSRLASYTTRHLHVTAHALSRPASPARPAPSSCTACAPNLPTCHSSIVNNQCTQPTSMLGHALLLLLRSCSTYPCMNAHTGPGKHPCRHRQSAPPTLVIKSPNTKVLGAGHF